MISMSRLTASMFAAVMGIFTTMVQAAEINIYSYRTPALLAPLLEAYTARTDVSFNVVHAPKGLVQRLEAEGAQSPADLVLSVDVSRLAELADKGFFAPLSSAEIARNVPGYLRDDESGWTALSTKARVVIAAKDRVAEGEIARIEDLADPKWQGRLCTRPGSHVYNRALLASLIAHHGEEEALKWARGYMANLARRPQGNDRAQAKAIFAGECDIALMNSYYFGLMKFNQEQPEQRQWADALRLVFLNQGDRGQHVNITGGGVLKTAPNAAQARLFLEWLTQRQAQEIYAAINYEYPVNPDVAADSEVLSWGRFKADELPVEKIAALAPAAQKLINITGW